MVDNIQLNVGTGGALLAAYDDGVAKHQRVKVEYGATATEVTSTAPFPVTQRADTATLSNVASSATSVTLLSANTARKGAILYNDSTSALYVKFGTTASTTSFSYYVGAGQHLELPSITYTGRIDGIWASANGNARMTELT